jgi:hypothetical protein
VQKNALLVKLACVGLMLCLVFPLGRMIYPYVADAVDHMSFSAIEAAVTASLGFGLYGALFN